MTRATSGWAAATDAEGRHQQRIVLAGLDGPDGQDVAATALGQGERHLGAGVGAAGSGRDPVMDGTDPLRIDAELGDHLDRPRTATGCAPMPRRRPPGG